MSAFATPAQPDPKKRLTALLSGEPATAEQISADFLRQLSLDRLNETIKTISNAIGPPRTIRAEPDGQHFRVKTDTHLMRVLLLSNAQGQISTLFFGPALPLDTTLAALAKPLMGGSGQTSLLVMMGREKLISHHSDKSLAIGSAFKLGVLAVLAQDIRDGKRQWSDIADLTDADKSLPSGLLQDFPSGSPVTLHMLAALMIAKSDNTATDMLIRLIGRQRVSKKLRQFTLTTRDLFRLKADHAAARAYLSAKDDKEREAALSSATQDNARLLGAANTPHSEGLEWYISAEKLCALLDEVAPLDLFSINPGVAFPSDWQSIAFKGGSEIGVLNLSTRLTAPNGDTYCVVFTRNAPQAIDDKADANALQMLISSLTLLSQKL